MASEGKKSDGHFWAVVAITVIALPVIYVLSLGPFLWFAKRDLIPAWIADIPIYAPIQALRDKGPHVIRDLINWYVSFWW